MIERSPYTLDAVQLENALQALQKAAETFRPSPSEERLYRALGICVRVAIATLAGLVLVGVLLAALASVLDDPSNAIFYGFGVLIIVFDWLFLLAALGALVFLLRNHLVVRQAFRQRRLLKKLGIREVSLAAWRLQRRGRRWWRLAGAVLTWGIILYLLFASIVVTVMSTTEEFRHSDLEKSFFVKAVIATVTTLAFGVTVLVWRFVQRSREQWAIVADANRLRSALESMHIKAGAGETVAIPAAMLEDVAWLEGVQIARERRDAVVASAGGANRGYGVLVARDLSPQKALLDPQHRVAVEDLIDNLSANPHPAGVKSTAEGLLSVRTPDGDVELQYSVDEGARRVHILALTTHHNG